MVRSDIADSDIIWRRGTDLTAAELHDLLRLRIEVFVVEQECAYAEVDGKDLLATTEHGWILDPVTGAIAASLRVLAHGAVPQIGRVVTHHEHRGKRLANRLLEAAHQRAGATAGSFLEAQTYLTGWYRRLGWLESGDEFVEEGIAHTPMTRPPPT